MVRIPNVRRTCDRASNGDRGDSGAPAALGQCFAGGPFTEERDLPFALSPSFLFQYIEQYVLTLLLGIEPGDDREAKRMITGGPCGGRFEGAGVRIRNHVGVGQR